MGANGDAVEGRRPIARFQSGAEAGYFADELTRTTGVEIEVLARERFDAVHAAWSIDYLLTTTSVDAARATDALRALVESSDSDSDAESDLDGERGDLPHGVWMPLLLTLAAGSIACWGIERADQRPRPAALVDRDPRLPADFWHALSATPGPWLQKTADGRGHRELTVDDEHQTAVLREDSDGDGRFDRTWRFDRGR